MKKCPACAEEVKDGAVKCKHCGEKFSEPINPVVAVVIGIIILIIILSFLNKVKQETAEYNKHNNYENLFNFMNKYSDTINVKAAKKFLEEPGR